LGAHDVEAVALTRNTSADIADAMWTPPRSFAFGVLRAVGASNWLASRIRRRDAVAVLNLHSVSPVANPFWPPIHPAHFDTWLRRALRVFEFRTFRTMHEPSNKPVAVLSFDDGYVDFYEHAMPILDRYGITANINVITGAIDAGIPPWNVRLYDWLTAASYAEIRDLRIEGCSIVLSADSKAAKVRFGGALSRFLKSRPSAERDALLLPLSARLATAPRGRDMLTPAQVSEIARRHEVGSHSHSHDSMGFETNAYFQDDFERSRSWLANLGIQTEIYAFPNGSYRPEQVAWLQEQGVQHTLLVNECFASSKPSSVLPRLSVAGGSVVEIELAALGMTAFGKVARFN
jgi:peptidoglycan/xylan/chitin deacetylase (PgdA/CDA1 family)